MTGMSEHDLLQIEALGFSLPKNRISFLDFLRQHLPGLRLKDFVNDIDDKLSPLTSATLLKEINFFEKAPQTLMIQYFSEDESDEKTGLGFARTFIKYPSELVVDHDFFRLPEQHRRQGKGRALISTCLKYYQECGVARIRLETGLEDGGLVWAKLFFTATEKSEVETILENARLSLTMTQYPAVKNVYDVYYKRSPEGRDFPMSLWSRLPGMEQILRKSRWHGELNLADQKVLTKFNLLNENA